MRTDILAFIQDVKKAFGLEARYFASSDVYSLRKNGKGVQNFNSKNFYDLPKSYRKAQIRALINVGLHHNMGEKTVKAMVHLNQAQGKSI